MIHSLCSTLPLPSPGRTTGMDCMIDTHCHLLDGIDDGPQEREDTLEMCRLASEDGIRGIVATPHSFDGRFINDPARIKTLVSTLNEELAALGLDLTVYPGMEARITLELFEHLDTGRLLPLNGGSYVLMEFHPFHVPAGFDNLVRRFLDAGFRTILAHPEKNLVVQSDPGYVFRLIRCFKPWEILIQITGDSLTGQNGFRASMAAKTLLKRGLVHLIASDAHSPRERPPRLTKALARAAALIGEHRAGLLVRDIPEAVISGKPFPPVWEPKEPRRWWEIFR